jgi:hypothetical protein
MAPYVGLLMPELQAAVVDPLPEVRATAARALGSLLRGMGAEHFADLVPWLLATLRSEVRHSEHAIHVCMPLACCRFYHPVAYHHIPDCAAATAPIDLNNTSDTLLSLQVHCVPAVLLP